MYNNSNSSYVSSKYTLKNLILYLLSWKNKLKQLSWPTLFWLRWNSLDFSHICSLHDFTFLPLLQISKASVKNWQSKLQTRYGWFKKENCKNIIFDVSFLSFLLNLTCSPPGSLQAVHGSKQDHRSDHGGALRRPPRWNPENPHPQLKVHGVDRRAGDARSYACREGEENCLWLKSLGV